MGYQKGKGLGKNEQGRVDIVEASKQRGRRGLGLHFKGLDFENIEWDPDEEVVSFILVNSWFLFCIWLLLFKDRNISNMKVCLLIILV